MNVLMLLAQGAMNMADSLATANPVLTPVSAPEMNMLDMVKREKKTQCSWNGSRIISIAVKSKRLSSIAAR